MEAQSAHPSHDRSRMPVRAGGAPIDVWAELARPRLTAATGDLWQHLADRLDLGNAIPKPAAGVVVRRHTGRDGEPYFVLRSPSWHYVRLDPDDFALWQRMDGRSTVREIAVAQFVERGAFVADRLAHLIQVLRAGGFVDGPSVDCFAALRDRLRSSGARRLVRRVVQRFRRPLVELR